MATAMVLVLIVVIASVGIRSGLLVTLAVPFSFFFAFIIISLLGFTYNFMVIFGLLLGLGMLIDGAIVMVEYADRKMAEGKDSLAAYRLAVNRMFWPYWRQRPPPWPHSSQLCSGPVCRAVHELPADHSLCGADWLAFLCPALRADHWGPDGPLRCYQ